MSESIDELIENAAESLARAEYAIALTGAGISTESGIADFRGPSGVWTKNPKAEQDAYKTYPRLLEDPKGWWEEMLAQPVSGRESLEKAAANSGHYALAELERIGVLKWTLTQNIDALHEKAGSKNLLEYHGTISKLRCMACNARYPRDGFDFEKMLADDRLPPLCSECQGVLKSDVVYFGEPIPSDIAYQSDEVARKCDVMLICGTSAVVYPFANLPRIAGQGARGRTRAATVIEVNAEPTPLTEEHVSDYLIQGKTGEILPAIAEAVRAKLDA